MEKRTIETVNLWGLTLLSSRQEEVLTWLNDAVLRKGSGAHKTLTLGTPNPEQVVLSRKSATFRHFLGKLDILLPDGAGLVAASRILGLRWGFAPLRERITGVDIAHALVESSIQKPRFVVMVVGGRNLQSSKWAWVEGYANVRNQLSAETEAIHEAIIENHPAVVCVALGAPHQERWLVENQDFLSKTGVKLAIAVGGAFDVLGGRLPRAPKWMRQLGLEWAYRLYREPWRWRRQAALISFIWMTIIGLFKKP